MYEYLLYVSPSQSLLMSMSDSGFVGLWSAVHQNVGCFEFFGLVFVSFITDPASCGAMRG